MAKINSLTPAEKIAALKLQIEAVENEQRAVEAERINKLAAQIDKLPESLGVDSLEGVLSLVRQRMKNTLGSVGTNITTRKRVDVDDATKAAAIESIRNGTEQRSQVAARLGIHDQTLFNWLKEAGLTNARGVSAPTVASVTVAQVAPEAVATA